ncbi:hypothetical protein Hanom_Chr07g00621211 [Helianthus anomalus]
MDLLAQDLGNDCMWLLTRGVPLILDRLVRSEELAKYMFDLGVAAYDIGHKNGYAEGKEAAHAKERDEKFELFKVDCTGNYTSKRQEYEFIEFGILKAIVKLACRGVAVETLKKVLKVVDAATGGASPSHQRRPCFLPACMPRIGLQTLYFRQFASYLVFVNIIYFVRGVVMHAWLQQFCLIVYMLSFGC